MAEETKTIYCCDRPHDNSAMWATLMANRDRGTSPVETMALMNGGFGGGAWNNPLK